MTTAPPPALPDLRLVESADVLKAGVQAGRLVRQGNHIRFSYDEDYLSSGRPQVASTLPLSGQPLVASGGSVPPFFAGLLPEGVRLTAVASAARTSLDDHLTLLLALGANTVGDVEIVPSGATAPDTRALFDAAEVGASDLVEVFARATGASPGGLDRESLPGVQVKVSAQMISTPVRVRAGGDAILKLNPPRDHPRLVQNEHFFLEMAAGLDFPTPRHQLVSDRNGVVGLLVERFDRTDAPDGYPRLEQEDATQLLDVFPAAKYRVKTEDVIRACAGWVEQGGGSGPLAVRRILELVAFSYLIGNGDLHGKNVSVRRRPDGIREVTPVYDVLSTQPYTQWRDPMAIDLYGRANKLDRRHLLEAAQRLRLPARALNTALDRIVGGAPAWIDRLGEIGLEDRPTELLAKLMNDRLSQLRGDG